MVFLWIALILFLIAAFAVWLAADYFVKTFFVRSKDEAKNEEDNNAHLCRDGLESVVCQIKAGEEYLAALPYEDVYIQSYDGLRLHARYYKNGESKRTILLAHGYKGSGAHDFACAFSLYRSLGLNFLVIDERAHGESEGKYICFGVRERYDVRDWCKFLVNHEPDCEIILGGISMGCTTVLLAAGLPDIPENIIGIAADCGFTSPHDEFVHVMKSSIHLPTFPMLYAVAICVRCRAKFGFNDVSTVDAVQKIKVPVLFIHGEADNFVLPEFTKRNFEACASENKQLLTVPGAAHGLSFVTDGMRCRRVLTEFIESL